MTETKNVLYRAALVVLLIAAVYGNTLNHRFVWDDNDIIVKSPLTQSLANIPQLFFSEDRTDDKPTGYYRPVTYVSFTIDRAIWGLNPVGFNITNLLLHICASLLFYRLIAALFKRDNLAFTASLVFALHPIVGETVNFHAGGRNTLLCACFALASFLCYLKERRTASLVFFALGAFCKEFALLVPALFLFHEWSLGKSIDWKRYLPYGVATLCYLALRSLAITTSNGILKTIAVSGKFLLIPKIMISYLANMLNPFQLKALYDVSGIVSWPSFAAYSAAVFLLLGAAWYFRGRREIPLAVFWFFLFLVPVCNILPLGASKMADRHAYFPLMGFSLAAGYLICLARKEAAIAVTLALCALFASVDVTRNGIWKDNDALFTRMIQDAPDRYVGYQVMGFKYYESGDLAKAEKYLLEAAAKKDCPPRNMVGDAWIFLEMNKLDRALAVLDKAIEIEPENPEPYVMAAKFSAQLGDAQRSARYREKALALDPAGFDKMRERGVAACRHGEDLMAAGDPQAERFIRDALNLAPELAAAQIDMGSIVAQKGDVAGAIGYFAKAAALEPANPAAHHNLALAYESLGKKEEARVAKEKALEAERALKRL